MKVSEFIIDYIGSLGVDRAFVVYGAANSHIIHSLATSDKMDYVCTMHEQFSTFAAEGYAKTSGKFGVICVTSGPGIGNCLTGIQNCYYDSVPCLYLSGQVNSQFMRPDDSI